MKLWRRMKRDEVLSAADDMVEAVRQAMAHTRDVDSFTSEIDPVWFMTLREQANRYEALRKGKVPTDA